MNKNKKPLGYKNYGSIPHLPGSRRGSADKGCSEQQAKLAIGPERKSKRHCVIVQEKLDGSNVGVAKIDGQLIPLGRAGWPAITSPYEQHRLFHNWAMENYERFNAVLNEGERLVGEWLAQAHGTLYNLEDKDPFVAFDLMKEHIRMPWTNFIWRVADTFSVPPLISHGEPCSVERAMKELQRKPRLSLLEYGGYHALEPVEGAVWRVEYDRPTGVKGESNLEVLFLAKYVRSDKVDGKYLPEVSEEDPVWNWRPE